VKTKILSVLAAGCLLGLAAWFVDARTASRPAEDPTSDGTPQSTSAPTETVSSEYDPVVQKGLDYLAAQQFEDGHWEGDGDSHPVAMTGMAGLAFLVEHNGFENRYHFMKPSEPEHKHSPIIRKAADWLMAQSRPGRDGLIFSEHPSETSRYMHGHGLATIFLAGVCSCEEDATRKKKLTEVLGRAMAYIVNAQSTQGGWHDTSKAEGHDFATVQATAIQVQALQAVQNAGIPVPQEVLSDGLKYLKSALEKGTGPADTAAAIASQRRWSELPPQNWLDDYRSKLPKVSAVELGRDEAAHFYYAQVLENLTGADYSKNYRTMMFRFLRDAQNADGSWPAGDGICVGRIYSTAVWCTLLQLGNGSHPSTQPVGKVT
jgi:Prenyltransferase and squalene oxidase repeat